MKTTVDHVQEVGFHSSMNYFSTPIRDKDTGITLIEISEDTVEKVQFNTLHVNLGSVCFIPREYRLQLQNIEAKARSHFQKKAVPARTEKRFMTDDMFDQYHREFVSLQKDLDDVCQDILLDYDDIVDRFVSLYESTVTTRKSRSMLLKKMRKLIPLKSEIKMAYTMWLNQEKIPHLDEREEIANRFLGKSLGISYNLLSSLEDAYSKGNAVKKRIVGHVKRQIPSIYVTNIEVGKRIEIIVETIESIVENDFFGAEAVFRKNCRDAKKVVRDNAELLDVLDMLKLK